MDKQKAADVPHNVVTGNIGRWCLQLLLVCLDPGVGQRALPSLHLAPEAASGEAISEVAAWQQTRHASQRPPE